jgi:hypothetical protein
MLPIGNQPTGECKGCHTFWPWNTRIKFTRKMQMLSNYHGDTFEQ